ncbi:unnamed protein product, partial [Ectocarpus sp. 12 AP-2014]
SSQLFSLPLVRGTIFRVNGSRLSCCWACQAVRSLFDDITVPTGGNEWYLSAFACIAKNGRRVVYEDGPVRHPQAGRTPLSVKRLSPAFGSPVGGVSSNQRRPLHSIPSCHFLT